MTDDKALTEPQMTACKEAAAAFCQAEMQFLEEYRPHMLAHEGFADRWAEFEAGRLAACVEQAKDMLFPFAESALKGVCEGLLDPHNKIARKLFTGVTGIPLPRGQGDTHAVLDGYFGESLTAYRATRDAERAAKAAERQAVEDAKQAKAAAVEAERMGRVKANCLAGENVSGDELVDLCRLLGVFVHPRSVKLWRDKIAAIHPTGARIYGKQTSTDTAHAAYLACRRTLQGELVGV